MINTDYKLIFDGVYKWSRGGKVADAIGGGFTRKQDARRALELYLLSKTPTSDIDKTATLGDLTTKVDLLTWAENNDIQVPPKYKQPSAIKKFLVGRDKD